MKVRLFLLAVGLVGGAQARTLPANPDGYLGNCRVEPPAAGRGARENAIRELGLSI